MKKLLIAIVTFTFFMGTVYAMDDYWEINGYKTGQYVDVTWWDEVLPRAPLLRSKDMDIHNPPIAGFKKGFILATKTGQIIAFAAYRECEKANDESSLAIKGIIFAEFINFQNQHPDFKIEGEKCSTLVSEQKKLQLAAHEKIEGEFKRFSLIYLDLKVKL